MIKSDLVERIAAQNPHLYKRDVENLVDAILGGIAGALCRGDRVKLSHFGTRQASSTGLQNCERGAHYPFPNFALSPTSLLGEWIKRADGLAALRIPNAENDLSTLTSEVVREYENLEDRAPVEDGCAQCTGGALPHKRTCAYHLAKQVAA